MPTEPTNTTDKPSPDQSSAGPRSGRVYARWPFSAIAVPVRLVHPGGTSIEVRLTCRNLSRSGIGLMHNAFVHVGSRVQVTLEGVDGRSTVIDGQVARCDHTVGIVHEIGITFDSPINIRDFVPSKLFDEKLTFETIDPADLTGTILHIEPNPIERRIVAHFLRQTRIAIQSTASAEHAMNMVHCGCDLIMCDFDLGQTTGPGLIQRMRAQGIDTPAIITGGKLSEPARQQIRLARVGAFLSKPFNQSLFLQHLAEFLCVPHTHEQHAAARFESDASPARLAARLGALGDQLQTAAGEQRPIDAYAVCVQLCQVAADAGRDDLARSADELSVRLSCGEAMSSAAEPLIELAAACRVAA